MNIKKVTGICWFIAGLSLIAWLVNVVIMINIKNWNSDVSAAIRTVEYVARTSFAISFVIGIILRYKSKEHKTDDKTKEIKN